MALAQKRGQVRFPPEVNRILYVKNLPHKISGDEIYDIFWQIWSHTTDQTGQHTGDARHSLRGVRGHLRRQERLRTSVWV